MKSAQKLKLTFLESQSFSPNTTIIINACGYPYSRRKANDGKVFVGVRDVNVETRQVVNDIVFSKGELGMGNRHFLIQYLAEDKSYYLKDLGEGTGTFIQVEKSINLQSDFILSFGRSHMLVNISPNNELQLEFLDGPNTGKTL